MPSSSENLQDLRFRRRNRLLDGAQFQPLFDQPHYRVSNPRFLFLARENDLSLPRLGMVIGRRRVRRAVDRARIKRIVRESFRHRSYELTGLDVVVLVRARIDHPGKDSLHRELETLWQRLLAKREQA